MGLVLWPVLAHAAPVEDVWTPELRAARDLYRVRCRSTTVGCAVTFVLLGLVYLLPAVTHGVSAGSAAAFGIGILVAAGIAGACSRIVTSPRQGRWMLALSLPVGVVLGFAVNPTVVEHGLFREELALLGGLTLGLGVAIPLLSRAFFASPVLVRRALDRGWDPAHPYRSFLRR